MSYQVAILAHDVGMGVGIPESTSKAGGEDGSSSGFLFSH